MQKRARIRENYRIAASIITISCLALSLFILSPNITGNVIGYLNITNFIGIILLLVGIVAGFFWIKSKKE
jgi:hypothetical protein